MPDSFDRLLEENSARMLLQAPDEAASAKSGALTLFYPKAEDDDVTQATCSSGGDGVAST